MWFSHGRGTEEAENGRVQGSVLFDVIGMAPIVCEKFIALLHLSIKCKHFKKTKLRITIEGINSTQQV